MTNIHNRFQSVVLLFLAFAVIATVHLNEAKAATIDASTNLEELSSSSDGRDDADAVALDVAVDNGHRVKRSSCDLGSWACRSSCQMQNCGSGYCSGGICRCSRCSRG